MTSRTASNWGTPFDDAARFRMTRVRSHDTHPELLLRSALHRRGRRFRIHIAPEPAIRRRADVVFPRARVAVFIDGCFWHGCPEHASWPMHNAALWREKIEGNRARDVDTTTRLVAAGWRVVRIWEHEDVETAADRVEAELNGRP